MAKATLTLSSRNYSSWSLRGWLLARFAGLDFAEEMVPFDDAGARAEILLLAPSILVPCLTHDKVKVWDTLAIAEYLHELRPRAGLLPADRAARAHCRAVCGEMHSGFSSLRSSLPMNIKTSFKGFKVWSRAQADIDRIVAIWRECLGSYGGPYLFGKEPCIADAFYTPVATRFRTYGVRIGSDAQRYANTVLDDSAFRAWEAEAVAEPFGMPEWDRIEVK